MAQPEFLCRNPECLVCPTTEAQLKAAIEGWFPFADSEG